MPAAPRARPQGPQQAMPPVGEMAPRDEGPPFQHMQGLPARRAGLWQVRRPPKQARLQPQLHALCWADHKLLAGHDHSRPCSPEAPAAWRGHMCVLGPHTPPLAESPGGCGVSPPPGPTLRPPQGRRKRWELSGGCETPGPRPPGSLLSPLHKGAQSVCIRTSLEKKKPRLGAPGVRRGAWVQPRKPGSTTATLGYNLCPPGLMIAGASCGSTVPLCLTPGPKINPD